MVLYGALSIVEARRPQSPCVLTSNNLSVRGAVLELGRICSPSERPARAGLFSLPWTASALALTASFLVRARSGH